MFYWISCFLCIKCENENNTQIGHQTFLTDDLGIFFVLLVPLIEEGHSIIFSLDLKPFKIIEPLFTLISNKK